MLSINVSPNIENRFKQVVNKEFNGNYDKAMEKMLYLMELELAETAEDLAAFDERENEPNLDFEEFVKKKDWQNERLNELLFMLSQEKSLENVWDNQYDEVWNDV
jgi:hypothetical protein